jgi:hypothetical protein
MDENAGKAEAEPVGTAFWQPNLYFFDALQAVPVPVVPFIELPFTVPV